MLIITGTDQWVFLMSIYTKVLCIGASHRAQTKWIYRHRSRASPRVPLYPPPFFSLMLYMVSHKTNHFAYSASSLTTCTCNMEWAVCIGKTSSSIYTIHRFRAITRVLSLWNRRLESVQIVRSCILHNRTTAIMVDPGQGRVAMTLSFKGNNETDCGGVNYKEDPELQPLHNIAT